MYDDTEMFPKYAILKTQYDFFLPLSLFEWCRSRLFENPKNFHLSSLSWISASRPPLEQIQPVSKNELSYPDSSSEHFNEVANQGQQSYRDLR